LRLNRTGIRESENNDVTVHNLVFESKRTLTVIFENVRWRFLIVANITTCFERRPAISCAISKLLAAKCPDIE
jgi:hypothetical protein